MEQADLNGDGLQPQDLSLPCTLPSIVFDLGGKGGDNCLLKANTVEGLEAALHAVQPPGWFVGGGTSEAMTFSEPGCHHSPLPGDQIQPDNAFSNTTVTLSYVSRSHIFSSNPLVQHCPLHDAPTLEKKVPNHALAYEALPLVTEAEAAQLCMEMDQRCLQQVSAPLGMTTTSTSLVATTLPQLGHEALQLVLPPQVMQNVATATGMCFLKHTLDLNAIEGTGEAAIEILTPLQQGSPLACKLTPDENGCHHNGDRALWDTQAYQENATEANQFPSHPEHMLREVDSNVLVLIPRTDQPLANSIGTTTDLSVRSLNGDYVSPLEDPVSPLATPQIEDVFVLPQLTAMSPSGENSPVGVAPENTDGHFCCPRPVKQSPRLLDNSNTESLSELNCEMPLANNVDTHKLSSDQCLDLSIEKTTGKNNKTSRDEGKSDGHVDESKALIKGLPERRILPPRSGRGVRLEAIVQNMIPFRSKTCSSIRSAKKLPCSKAEESKIQDNTLEGDLAPNRGQRETVDDDRDCDHVRVPCPRNHETSLHEVSSKVWTSPPQNTGDAADSLPQGSTSDSELVHATACSVEDTSDDITINSNNNNSNKATSPSSATAPTSAKKLGAVVNSKSFGKFHEVKRSTVPKSLQKKTGCGKPGSVKSSTQRRSSPLPTTKQKTAMLKKRSQKLMMGPSSLFAPKEPEIRLKYLNYKEEKRDTYTNSFSPFIHVQREPNTCAVINSPEEERATCGNRRQSSASSFVAGVIPSTPSLQYGRISTEASHRASLVCCLCGRSANTLDLGDLHGPYYAEGYKPEAWPTEPVPCLEDWFASSDMLEDDSGGLEREEDCGGRVTLSGPQGKARVPVATSSLARRVHQRSSSFFALAAHQRWASQLDFDEEDDELSHSPVTKWARMEGSDASGFESWYRPPVVPLDPCEYWLHEDCGIWTAGIFLVKGRLYGVEKAAKMAKQTMCSSCHRRGATLGCFFKECPNKYHYICALQSNCVLNEENFSMKCTKHKNKAIKGSTNRKNPR